jgi:aspartyl-tRNA(Asn)/glutamyl-tRNA(Gln) amidotransferase subunit C
MSVSYDEIKTMARLARLQFTDEDCKQFSKEFDEIIAFADTINSQVEGDTSSIREVSARTVKWEDLRDDVVVPSLDNEKILSNVESDNGFFPVKRVVK